MRRVFGVSYYHHHRKSMTDPEVENSGAAVSDCGSDDNSEMATSVSGFAAAEQQRTENGKQSIAELNRMDSDMIGRFCRTEPINLTTPAGDKNSDNVEGRTARSAGTRSQYHSIQQLSQSGRPGDSCGLFSGAEATMYGQAWLGCGRCPVDVASECEEDTLHILRSLLRRYDRCAEPRTAVGIFDGGGNESDEAASGMASNSDLSGDDVEDRSPPPVPLKRSPSTTTLQAKRARVEHIVSNIRTPTCAEDAGATGSGCSGGSPSLEPRRADGRRRSKRKQTLPQQHDSATFNNEDHRSLNGNASDVDDDDDSDENRMLLPQEPDDEEEELRHQMRIVQLRLEDMYAKYSKSLQVDDLYLSASRSSDDDKYLEPDSKMNNEAERLTNVLKAEVRHVVDGLVDVLIQRFLTKHFAGRRQPLQSSPSTDDQPRLDFPLLSPVTSLPSLPVFPPPPLFPFPVGGGDMLGLRRAYAERCAYVDALVQRARTTCATDRDSAALNYNNSTSGSVSCTAMTSSSTEVVDHRSLMSVMSSHCLLPDQQLLQPRTQV